MRWPRVASPSASILPIISSSREPGWRWAPSEEGVILGIGIGVDECAGGVAQRHRLRAGVVEDTCRLAPIALRGAVASLPGGERHLPIHGERERAECIDM